MKSLKSGEIYFCDFGENRGSIQGGARPCIIVDNVMACTYSPCIHCVPLTTRAKRDLPLHYEIITEYLEEDSIALCEQYQLVDKSQLLHYIGRLEQEDLIIITELCKKNLPFNYR